MDIAKSETLKNFSILNKALLFLIVFSLFCILVVRPMVGGYCPPPPLVTLLSVTDS